MNLSNYFWHFKSALTPKFCDDVIQYGLSKSETMARTGGFGDKKLTEDDLKNMKRKRNSNITWLDDPWIYREIHPYITKPIKMLVGILIGIGLNHVSLQNTNTTNIMIGIKIVGINLMINPVKLIMVKLENYQ